MTYKEREICRKIYKLTTIIKIRKHRKTAIEAHAHRNDYSTHWRNGQNVLTHSSPSQEARHTLHPGFSLWLCARRVHRMSVRLAGRVNLWQPLPARLGHHSCLHGGPAGRGLPRRNEAFHRLRHQQRGQALRIAYVECDWSWWTCSRKGPRVPRTKGGRLRGTAANVVYGYVWSYQIFGNISYWAILRCIRYYVTSLPDSHPIKREKPVELIITT